MKKTNKIIVALIIIATILGSYFTALCGVSKADEYEDILDLYVYSGSIYEINPQEILAIYAYNQKARTEGGTFLSYRYAHDVNKGTLIPVDWGAFQDDIIDSSDAARIKSYGFIESNTLRFDNETVESVNNGWFDSIADIQRTIANYYEEQGKEIGEIKVTVNVVTPAIEELGIAAGVYDYSVNTDTGVTQEIYNKMKAVAQLNETANEEDIQLESLQLLTVIAETEDGTIFEVAVGSDNNIYLLDPESINDDVEFTTTMSYTAFGETTQNNGEVYLPPYTDNDNPNKDADVTVTIKSTTGQDIVAVVVGETTADLSKDANALGWYYPDETDKTVIAKQYPFDDYDKTTYNGKVSETVTLISDDDQEDTQKPQIEWTFRRKTKEETENPDGSITVVITYNLPVDSSSIPSDWAPIYDEDGETIHKITKTIKKGENYKKDVTVKQNGGDKTVTTPVEKVWQLPKTGDIWTFATIGMVIVVAFTISRRRKISKM